MTTKTQPTPPSPTNVPDKVEAQLLDVQGVAKLLNCSPRTVYRLADGGKMPRPLRLGSLVRWRRAELLDWLDGGCPAVRSTQPRNASRRVVRNAARANPPSTSTHP